MREERTKKKAKKTPKNANRKDDARKLKIKFFH